ncbi:hypothetical protein [Corynebacterium sp.]|uniref:hypothetical protein n=1 Tax=Corynebacterium sp. TaxID=1720 RepID=UPI0026DBA1FA|nr:hypothetical protein [Corynebacterium sp.]MDO5031426.1 hypothetical protein [Corynebacterium sp.]
MIKTQFRVPRAIGFGAGSLAVSLIVYSLAGALWGVFRPTLSGTRVNEAGAYQFESLDNVEFTAFITFAVITGLIGMVFGAVMYQRNVRYRGLLTLLWAGVVCLAGAAAFYVVGGVTATSVPEELGEVVEFAPKFTPQIAWLVAPFMAMFAYWSAAFVDVDSAFGTGEEAEAEAEDDVEAAAGVDSGERPDRVREAGE